MIDEKRLIEEMKRTFPDKLLNDKNWFWGEASFMDLFKELVEEQPKVGEWIPCSERLPSKAELWDNMENEFIVTIKGVELPTALFYDADYEEWSDGEDAYEVIAWMLLPPAYKGE